MKTETTDDGRFEINAVHHWPDTDETHEEEFEICEDTTGTCEEVHVYGVYYREPVSWGLWHGKVTTEARWLADCATLELARVATVAFAGMPVVVWDSRVLRAGGKAGAL